MQSALQIVEVPTPTARGLGIISAGLHEAKRRLNRNTRASRYRRRGILPRRLSHQLAFIGISQILPPLVRGHRLGNVPHLGVRAENRTWWIHLTTSDRKSWLPRCLVGMLTPVVNVHMRHVASNGPDSQRGAISGPRVLRQWRATQLDGRRLASTHTIAIAGR
jgi:hypothetical protein